MYKRIAVITLGSSLLTGCFGAGQSQAPIATTYPISDQQKMQAAHHWDVLAEHEANAMLDSSTLSSQVLFVNEGGAGTAFSRSFKSLITSKLVSNGGLVQTSPAGAANVTFEVNVVEHTDRESIRAPQGAWTALTAGIAVAHIPFANNWSEPSVMLVPAAIFGDVFSGSWTNETDFEVVITTQATVGNRIVYSSSNIYYINGGDSDHYSEKKSMPVTNNW